MKKYSKTILTFSIISIVFLISIFSSYNNSNIVSSITNNKTVLSYNSVEQEDFVYLSDLDYIEDDNWSYAG